MSYEATDVITCPCCGRELELLLGIEISQGGEEFSVGVISVKEVAE